MLRYWIFDSTSIEQRESVAATIVELAKVWAGA
jgi:hypothetical protein